MTGPDRPERSGQPVVMVALEVLLPWPRDVGSSVATVEEARRWPVFVVVVGDRPGPEHSSAAPLFDLLDRPAPDGEQAAVTGLVRWSVVDRRLALLRLSVHATAPARFAAEIIVPAQRVLGVLDVVARGATIGLTTRRHVGRLAGRVDIRTALPEVVLLDCPPSSALSWNGRSHDALG